MTTYDPRACPKCKSIECAEARAIDAAARADLVRPSPTPDPRAWRVAIALAHECGLDWARWARGETNPPKPRTVAPWTTMPCDACGCDHLATRGVPRHAHVYLCEACEAVDAPGWIPSPVPAPWDADAYLADCARRQVEPGPLPSLEYDDGRVRWKVFGVGRQLVVELRVGKFRGSVWSDGDMFVSTADESPASVHDHPDFSRVAAAAAKAMALP